MANPSLALDLWGVGHDTADIARILKLKNEAEALKRLTVERSAMRGLPIPYASRADAGSSKPVRPSVGKRKLSRPPIGLRCGA
jgi:hypothetical protein